MKRTSRLSVVVAALVLLVGALFLFQRSRPAKPAAPARTAAPTAMEAPPAPKVPPPSAEPSRGAPLTLSAAVAERDESAENGLFEGRVVNWATGRGVPRAEVTFAEEGGAGRVSTDEEGRFRFAPRKAGRCTLALVTAADYLPFAPEWGQSPFELQARPRMRVRDITVYLVPAIDYLGTVVDPDGKPVSGATVMLLGAASGEQALVPIRERFTSDDKGEFHFHAPDGALLEARHASYGPGRARLDGPAATSHHLEIRLSPKESAAQLGTERITGRVVTSGGTPVGGATVHARPLDVGADKHHPAVDALSDADGRFTLEGLDPGPHTVVAAHAGFAPATAERVAAGSSDVVLTLQKGGALAGRVIDTEGGVPLPAFTIIVTRRDGPVKESTIAVRSVIDPDGRFLVPDLAPGPYRVRASAHAHAPSKPLDATVPDPPAEAAPIEIALGRGAKVVGTVIEAGGGPLAGARVSLENAFGDASTTTPIAANALTDDRGAFELAGIPPGPRSITVAAYKHHIRILSGMSFVDGATVGPITVDLSPTKDGEEPRIELAGIGAVLVVDGDGLRIDKTIAGGGAEASGLVPGDVVLSIDGQPVSALGFGGSIEVIRGPVGTTVRLTLRRTDGSVLDVSVPRRRIRA